MNSDLEETGVENRKTWAIILGATAGVAMVSLAATWYVKTHRGEPIIKDVGSMISAAHSKIQDLEQALVQWHSGEQPV